QKAALLEIGEVDLEGRRVHGDERVRLVAGREHLVRRELDLVPGNARGGARRRANFRREIRKRRQVVAVERRLAGELRAGELHAVAGVAGKPDDGLIQVAWRAGGSLVLHQGSSDAGLTGW